MFTLRDEIDALTGERDPTPVKWRQAVVTAVDVGPPATYTLELGGATTTIPGVRSLVPLVVGDTVWCVRNGTDLLIVGHIDTGWLEIGAAGAPAWENNWQNYTGGAGAGTDWRLTSIRKAQGVVYIDGLVAGGTNGQSAFTLDVGWRPFKHQVFTTWSSHASEYTVAQVGPDGRVVPNIINPHNGYVALHAIRFIAEQ